jgi:hypothetical protein
MFPSCIFIISSVILLVFQDADHPATFIKIGSACSFINSSILLLILSSHDESVKPLLHQVLSAKYIV